MLSMVIEKEKIINEDFDAIKHVAGKFLRKFLTSDHSYRARKYATNTVTRVMGLRG